MPWKPARQWTGPFSVLAVAIVACAPAAAQPGATNVLVVDRDAEGVSALRAGALFNVDLADPIGTAPLVEASALAGAPFEFLSAVSIDPVTLNAFITDLGATSGGGNAPGALHVLDGRTAARVTRRDPKLVDPWDLTFLPDGRLVVVDSESDPSSLGADAVGGAGHGALFWVAPATGVATLLADGRNHSGYAGAPVGSCIFQDPVSVAYDALSGKLFVADNSANPLGLRDAGNNPILGAVFSVDVTSGLVTLVSSSDAFFNVVRVAVRPDGKVLVVDALENDFDSGTIDSVIFVADPANTNVQANLSEISRDERFGLVEDVAIDPVGDVFLVDSGVYSGGSFLIDPRVWRIDRGNTNLATNGMVVNESADLLWPVGLEVVPGFDLNLVTPDAIPLNQAATCGPIVLQLQGAGLVTGLDVSLGAGATIVGASGSATGSPTVLDLEVDPLAAGTFDVSVSHPFGESVTLAGAYGVVDVPAVVPAPPCSPFGDASCDGLVDGLDLAILGRHYGATACNPLLFENDADFDDDDFIDGDDLAILATAFGSRP